MMAKRQGYELPDDARAQAQAVDREIACAATYWGNAREIRTLLEHAREAQALRISKEPNADLSRGSRLPTSMPPWR